MKKAIFIILFTVLSIFIVTYISYKKSDAIEYYWFSIVVIMFTAIILYKEIKLREELQLNNRKLETIIKEADSGIGVIDLEGNFLEVNQVYSNLLGYSKKELLHLSCLKLTREKDKELSKYILETANREGKVSKMKKTCIKKDGSEICLELSLTLLPSKEAFVVVINSLEETKELEELNKNLFTKVKEKTQALKHQYYHDALTGLGNRNSLLQNSEFYGANGLMLIDIDRFSTINSIYGEKIGDAILINVSKILIDIVGTECSVHRISGDQFAYLNINCHDLEFCIAKAKQTIQKISSTAINASIDGFSIKVNLSVTISIVHNNEKNNFLECADMALNYAKRTHQSLLVYSDDLGLKKHYFDDLKAVALVKKALEEDTIIPFFQKIIKEDGIAYECLARIIENKKIISPFFFIEAIKKTPYYHELTKTMIRKSIDFFKDREESFSINLSYEDISNADIIKFINEQLSTTDIADQLIFEILETESIENFNVVRDFIMKMKVLGVRIAIDDFGSGYANFSHLIELKPDYIKIDGSLIKNIDKDENAYILVKAITSFTKEMHIKVIAEYIHSEEVYKKVQELDIYGYQGYFFSEPLAYIE